jgi:general secretion pathway protein C
MLVPRRLLSFRIIELGFITVGAFLIADIASLLIEQRLDVPVLAPYSVASQDSPSEQRSPRAFATAVMQRGVLGPASDGGTQAVRRPVSQKVRLVGTVVGERSVAILEDVSTLQQGMYRLHERVPGTGQIAAIERNRITVVSGSSQEILEVGVEESVPAKTADPESIQEPLARRVVLDRQLIQNGYENLTTLMTQGRVAPSLTQGKSNGFIIREIAKGSLFERAGLRNNDILQRINGVEVNDPETLFKMFMALKDESSISLDVLRGGQVESYAYEIR